MQAVLASHHAPRQARPALLRRQRVRGRASARRGGRRRRRGRGDDLRPRLRDPRRPRRRAGRRGTRATSSPRRCATPLERYLFAEDERTIAEIVLELCRARGLPLATAESCTGGLVAARLTDVPGRERRRARRHRRLRERGEDRGARCARGRCSPSTAPCRPRSRRPWRAGVRDRLGADVGIAVTGVAGPGGGTRGEAGRARLLPRRRRPTARGPRSSRSPATATRSGRARPSPRSISCGAF